MSRALVSNAADEEQVKRAGTRHERAEERAMADLRSVLSTPEGRRFYWRTLGFCRPLEDPETGDTHLTYRNLGVQSVGRYLIAEMEKADPRAWDRMKLEAKENESNG